MKLPTLGAAVSPVCGLAHAKFAQQNTLVPLAATLKDRVVSVALFDQGQEAVQGLLHDGPPHAAIC